MKKTLILLLAIGLVACKNTSKEEKPTQEIDRIEEELPEEADEPILVGKFTRRALEDRPYSVWLEKNYTGYQADKEVVKQLKTALADVDIIVAMGTWCEDSQEHVPALLRVLDMNLLPANKVQIIALTRDKDSPQGYEKDLSIEFVPTIILQRDGQEIGRIVEMPVETIEKDLLNIATGKPYRHIYEL